MEDIKTLLRQIIGTGNSLTLPISGTGSAGMETSFVNLLEGGDRVLILSNGVFGQRMADVAGRLRAEVDTLEFPWGTPVVPEAVRDRLAEREYDLVAVVHAETSTGVCNPVAEIGRLVRACDALYLVDTVTSLGGIPVTMDAWGADVLYSGTQKCLSCPPGLAPVSFSERAVAKLQTRSTKVPNWYLDLTMIIKYWEARPASTITPPRSICCTACTRPCAASSTKALNTCFNAIVKRTSSWSPAWPRWGSTCWWTHRTGCRC